MIQQKFKITINAPTDKVWRILWNDDTYCEWTAVFSEGSYAKTDWKEGSRAYFLTQDGRGMVSSIRQNVPDKYMSIEHLGIITNGVEDYKSTEAKQWAGAMEDYILEHINDKTLLHIEMDVVEGYKNFFLDTWPKALEKIKALAEKQS
ncbi:MAG: SRPBCC domain-containing protein [Muricauda sp.]|nr:SRPBCC domain-containing protein [Allomuricauda sp.]MBA4744384.1 SRPBCC domain-containing protein [Allomuricauda sp.]